MIPYKHLDFFDHSSPPFWLVKDINGGILIPCNQVECSQNLESWRPYKNLIHLMLWHYKIFTKTFKNISVYYAHHLHRPFLQQTSTINILCDKLCKYMCHQNLIKGIKYKISELFFLLMKHMVIPLSIFDSLIMPIWVSRH